MGWRLAQHLAFALDHRHADGVFVLYHHAGTAAAMTPFCVRLTARWRLQVQPDHYWGFLGCFYVIDSFLIVTFARAMLLWDDWSLSASLDDEAQAAALMPELRHPDPNRRLRATSQLLEAV